MSSSFRTIFIFFIVLFNFCSSIAQDNIYEICRNGSLEQIESLYALDNKIINTPNEKGYLPLTLACYHNNKEVVFFLVDKVEDIDANNDQGTALMAATFKKDKRIVELLLKHNANPNITDNNGTTAMHYATMFKNYDIIKLLVNANADINIKDNTGKSPIDFAKAYNDDELNKILKLK